MGMQVFDVITDYFVPDFELDAYFWNQFVPVYNSSEVAEESPRCDDAPFFIVSPGKPCRLHKSEQEKPKEAKPESIVKTDEIKPEFDFVKKIEFWPILQAQYPKAPLSDVRKIMDEAINSDRNVVVATTPGSGKTTSIKARIETLCEQESTVLYAAPIIDLVKETYNDITAINSIRYEARRDENCKHYDLCKIAMALNKSVFERVCQRKCDEKKSGPDRCWYLAQLDDYESGVIAGTHAAAPYIVQKIAKNNNMTFNEIIIDETPRPDLISSDSITLRNFRLFREGMQETGWFKKISSYIDSNMSRVGDKYYIQMPLGISQKHVDEINNSGAWEAMKKVVHDADTKQHKRNCVEREKQNIEYNKRLPKLNKARLKQHKLEKETFLASQIKSGILIAQEKYPDFVPLPEKYEMPPFPTSALPDRKSWEEKWQERTWITREECPIHAIGIDGKDIAEAVIQFEELVRIYEDSPADVNGNEFEFLRAALGLSEDDAWIEVKEGTKKHLNPAKNDDPDEEDEIEKIVSFRVVKFRKMELGNSRLVVLDGTADEEELKALFNCDFDFVKADSVLKPTHTVFFEQSFGSRDARTLAKMATRKKRPPDDSRLRYLLKRSISKLKKTDKKVLVLTFKSLVEILPKIASELDPTRQYVQTHYYGNRGLNEFEDCDAVIAIGTPMVSPIDFIPLSIKLFGYVNEQWIARQGLRELIQSIHRIRPINHETTIILTGSYFPVEAFGQPVLWVNAQRDGERGDLMQEAIDLLVPIAKKMKCLTQEMAEEHGFFDEEDFAGIEAYLRESGKEAVKWPAKKWSNVVKAVAQKCGIPVSSRPGKMGRPRVAAGAARAFVALEHRRRREAAGGSGSRIQ